MQSPLIPPPTMTQSAMDDSPPSILDEEIVGPSATEHRSLKGLRERGGSWWWGMEKGETEGEERRRERSIRAVMIGGGARRARGMGRKRRWN